MILIFLFAGILLFVIALIMGVYNRRRAAQRGTPIVNQGPHVGRGVGEDD